MSDDLSKLEKNILEIIKEGVKKTESMPSPCIFRVPEELRKVKESAYTPQLVSIGPLHSNKKHLKSPMEDIKKKYVQDLFDRVNKDNNTTDAMLIKKCVEKMKPSLDRARDCYAEEVEVDALEDVEKMKESLDKAKECNCFTEKVDVRNVEKMKELLDIAKECKCFSIEKVHVRNVEKMKELLDKAKECKCFTEKVEVRDVEKMKKSLDTAKECFAEKVDALDVTMLIIDGCFILQLLYRYHHEHKPRSKPNSKPHEEPHHTDAIKTRGDLCFDSAPTRVTIKHDLLLLENQLPFFVLEDLFDLTVATTSDHLTSLSDYLHSYFGNMMNPLEQGCKNDGKPNICEGVSHILHFLYNQYRDPRKQEGRKEQQDCCGSPKTDANNYDSMPPASELEYAGVKFESPEKKSKPGDQDSPFKVQFDVPQGLSRCFHRASFNILTLRIGAATETLLRNLIAFEQCYTGLDLYFTSYAVLMDRLVDTKNDVAVLEKAEIIRSCLGDREKASDLFNSLCKEIVLPRDNFYFAHTCNAATSYSKECWPKFMAQLRRTCFANPWTFIAFLVAFIAFGVSVAQAIRNFLR